MPETTPYRRILAVIDFDQEDAEVLARAQSLAKACGAQLGLLHIVDLAPVGDAAPGGVGAHQARLGYARIAERRLQAMAKHRGLADAPCFTSDIHHLSPLEVLRTDWNPDLVVVAAPRWVLAHGAWDLLVLHPQGEGWFGRLKRWLTQHTWLLPHPKPV